MRPRRRAGHRAAWRCPAQIRLLDDTDRSACRAWFVVLADAQFYRPTADVTDCAGLVRHALRESLRAHTTEWLRQWAVPGMPTYPDVRRSSAAARRRLAAVPRRRRPLRGVRRRPDDRPVQRPRRRTARSTAARPGDLLFFHQDTGTAPDHLMVFVGPSVFDPLRTRLGRLPHGAGRRERGRGAEGPRSPTWQRHPAPGGVPSPPTRSSSASSAWRSYEHTALRPLRRCRPARRRRRRLASSRRRAAAGPVGRAAGLLPRQQPRRDDEGAAERSRCCSGA